MQNLPKEHENQEDKEFKEDTSEINDTNESKLSKYKTEEALISSLLANIFSLKVTQAVIFSINTYKQDMIAVGNKNKKIKKQIKMELLSSYTYVIIIGGKSSSTLISYG